MTKHKNLFKLVLFSLFSCVFFDTVVLSAFPRLIALIFQEFGVFLDPKDNITVHCMGLAVRLVGLSISLLLIKRFNFFSWFTTKLDRKTIALSWLFFVYILFNFNMPSFSDKLMPAVIFMMIDALAIGFYEEFVFRGLILPAFLKKFGSNNKQVLFSVIFSSGLFGLFHITNVFAGDNIVGVLTQVIYATVFGIAFSALFLRSGKNILWVGLLHGAYDMAKGFGEFSSTSAATSNSILFYLINLALFIPILIYSLYLLRRVSSVNENGEVLIS